MLVINIAGYNFGFKHKGVQYEIPFDYKPYPVPDDSPRFRELRILKVVETLKPKNYSNTNNVVNVNKNFFDFENSKAENSKFEDLEDLQEIEDLEDEPLITEVKIPKKRVFSKFKKKK